MPSCGSHTKALGTLRPYWAPLQQQLALTGGNYVTLGFNLVYEKKDEKTLKQALLNQPSDMLSLPALEAACGLQISFCTGVAQQVPLRILLADVMVAYVEQFVPLRPCWVQLKDTYRIVDGFKGNDFKKWIDGLPTRELQEETVRIVHGLLEVLKDTGINSSEKKLVVALICKETVPSCFELPCNKANLWTRILEDSEHCATFACITSTCLETNDYKCQKLPVAQWHSTSGLLDTEVCYHTSNRNALFTTQPLVLVDKVAYWIGPPDSKLLAKVEIRGNHTKPELIVTHTIVPEKFQRMLVRIVRQRIREKGVIFGSTQEVIILAHRNS